jgi:serine protease AprX
MRTLTAAAPDQVRLRVRAAAALLAALLVASLLSPLTAAGGSGTWVVSEDAPLPVGARVLARLSVVDALLVSAPSAPIGGIAADTPLSFKSVELASVTEAAAMTAAATTGAEDVWAGGNRGAGSVVALIDSGVAPLPALQGAVVGEIDFSGTGGGDPYGHGTFMASLIAARSASAPGVAPEAGVLSLKVGDTEGSTTLGTVLRALEWLHRPGRASGVRIAALALGVDAGTPAAQLLDDAADRLAAADVLVVTASGNDGPGHLTSPATATRTFSVGAFDPAVQGTAPTAADFSGTGTDRAGVAQPDALAAGVDIVGHLDASSVIGRAHSADLVDGTLRGSGTSMATALAAGVAALAQTARPDLGGTALDVALRNDAGIIDAPDAVTAILDAPRPHPGNGHAHGVGNRNGNASGNGNGNAATAPGQVRRDPAQLHWSITRWKHVHWSGDRWHIVRWKDDAWSIVRWKGDTWTIVRWKAASWNGTGWGDASWEGGALGGSEWTGDTWRVVRWKAEQWGDGDPTFTTVRWKADAWTMLTRAS